MILNTAQLFRKRASSAACHIIRTALEHDGSTAAFPGVQFHKSRVWQKQLWSHLNITPLIGEKRGRKKLSSLKWFRRAVWFASGCSACFRSPDLSRCIINELVSLESFEAMNWWWFKGKMTHQLICIAWFRHFFVLTCTPFPPFHMLVLLNVQIWTFLERPRRPHASYTQSEYSICLFSVSLQKKKNLTLLLIFSKNFFYKQTMIHLFINNHFY